MRELAVGGLAGVTVLALWWETRRPPGRARSSLRVAATWSAAWLLIGLLPAAVMGLDVRALLLGAAAMTRRFLEEPLERNPVLQYAGVNYLMTEEFGKPIRVLSI